MYIYIYIYREREGYVYVLCIIRGDLGGNHLSSTRFLQKWLTMQQIKLAVLDK